MKYPVIDSRATGVNLRRIMDAKDITVKELKEFLGLSSIQSIYHWLNGICLPSIDNLYAMSIYFGLPMDALICGRDEHPLRSYGSFLCSSSDCSETTKCCNVLTPGTHCSYHDSARHCNCLRTRERCPYCNNTKSHWNRFSRRIKLLWEYLPESVRPDHLEVMALDII